MQHAVLHGVMLRRTGIVTGDLLCYGPGSAAHQAAKSGPLRCVRGTGSAHRELQQLDGVEILHAAADALGGVEQHVGLCGIRIAQHPHALAVDDQIAAAEIAERDRQRT